MGDLFCWPFSTVFSSLLCTFLFQKLKRVRVEVAAPWRTARCNGCQRNVSTRELPHALERSRRRFSTFGGTGHSLRPPQPFFPPPPKAARFEHPHGISLLSRGEWQLSRRQMRGQAPLTARGVLVLHVSWCSHPPCLSAVGILGASLQSTSQTTTPVSRRSGSTR